MDLRRGRRQTIYSSLTVTSVTAYVASADRSTSARGPDNAHGSGMRRPPRASLLPVLCALLAGLVTSCRTEVDGERIEDTTGVVVRLPVRLPDQTRAAADTSSSPSVPLPAGGAQVASPPTMEVPAVPVPTPARVDSSLDGVAYLRSRRLMVPVDGVEPSTLIDSFGDERGGGSRSHGALDIHAPKGTSVVAADDGRIEKLHESVAGGITLYQFDPSGRFVYYYAHLDGYRPGLAEGDVVARGTVLGYVGETGNAPPGVPHLHFAIGRMDAERRWWKFDAINPLGLLVERGRASSATPTRAQINPP
jgi:murein DD-endopeptidase MepM/ murein hydrolase activator NlpD